MAANKTKQTEASVASYFAAIKDEARRHDCEALASLMSAVTKESPKMWGPSIVGFGAYRYKYASGREGEICLVGFSSRTSAITVYGLEAVSNDKDLLSRLGPHRLGKGCLYLRGLGEIDRRILKQMIVQAAAERRKQR